MRAQRLTSWLSFEGFGVPSPFDPTFHYVTSPVFSPLVLGALRLLFAVYALVTVIIVLAHDSVALHAGNQFLPYFTDLTYIGLVAYFWASSVQTIAFFLRGQKSYPLQAWPRILQVLHVILCSTIIVFPIVVTIVFWTLLSSPATFETTYSSWSELSRHALNSAFALFEIFLTHAHPGPWSHLIPLILILAGYLGIAYITHETQGYYTYSFLDPSTEHGRLAAYVIGIAVGCCIVFGIVKGLCELRRRISVRYGRFEGRSDPEAIEEWENVTAPKDSLA